MMRIPRPTHLLAVGLTSALALAACGSDDTATSTPGTEAPSAAPATDGPATIDAAPGTDAPPSEAEPEVVEATPEDSGYAYASNVDSHRLVVLDVCSVKDLLDADPIDYDAINVLYVDGENSVKSDGYRTIGGFAANDDRAHGLADFYEVPAPLNDFVTGAIAGTGIFDGASDDVRSQGIEKGIQNQIMTAWVVHELNTALAKAAEGNFDVQSGAVHNWDEGWAFYAGAEAGCGPYGTADKRGENFGTLGADGSTSLANEAILAAMIDGRDALLAEDVAGAEAATAEVIKNVAITYSQAIIRYGTLVEADLVEGDADAAAKHIAEGLAFWRVIEAYVTPAGADGDIINAIFALDGEPGANGGSEEIRTALQPAWDALGITDDDIGVLV